jgi:hypothetical protein
VSLWSHKSLRVIVCPDQVALLPLQGTLGLRGLRRAFHDPVVLSCTAASGGQPWRAAVRELEMALPDFAKGGAAATVILSNHFLRYTLVPWHAELADAEEELAFARHCFSKVYGNEAQAWELRLSHEASEMPRLASAVDAELLSALRGVFAGAAVPLRSVQPHLMAAFNGFRKRLQQPGAWFALLEPGNLCLARLQRGNWMQLRSVRIGSAWREELPLILEREAFLADSPEVPHEVYVCGADPDDAALPQVESWRFHALAGGLGSGGGVPIRPVSMAMAG